MMRWALLAAAMLGGCRFVVPGVDELGAAPIDLAADDLPEVPVDLAQPDLTPPPSDLALPPARTCTEVLQRTPGTTSGVYPIDPGLPTGTPPLMVYCDMTDEKGGWTLVQRTVYDATENSQLITGYAGFYGTTLGQPTNGHAFRVAAQYWPALNPAGDHLMVIVPRAMDASDCQRLVYRGFGAIWSVAAPPGPATIGPVMATSSVSFFNGVTQLSTNDVGPSQTCVNTHSCVPWPLMNCCYICPTYAGHPEWFYTASPDTGGTAPMNACGGGPPASSQGFALLNVMEYYVR